MNHLRTRLRTAAASLAALAAAATLTTTVTAATTGPSEAAAPRRLPDLAVTAIRSGTRVDAGQRLDVAALLVNRGRATSRWSTIRFSLSRDARPGGDIPLGPIQHMDGLLPRERELTRDRVVVPDGTKPGTYRLIACVIPRSRDASRPNDCRVGATVTVVEAPWVGRLSGTLTLDRDDDRSRPEEGYQYTSSGQLRITFDIDVDERRGTGWEAFETVGSDYSFTSSVLEQHTESDCVRRTERSDHGADEIIPNGHPYYDTFYGDFTSADHSRGRILTQLEYRSTTRRTWEGRGDHPCASSSSTSSASPDQIDVLELVEVRRSPDEVVYRVVPREHANGQKTTWERWSGTLVFTHAG